MHQYWAIAAVVLCMPPSQARIDHWSSFHSLHGYIVWTRYISLQAVSEALRVTDEYVAETIADVNDDISLFIFTQLRNNQPRDGYREILELALVFLGRVPPTGIKFMAPGPMHHAKWINKVIYSLKVLLFRGQIKLTT